MMEIRPNVSTIPLLFLAARLILFAGLPLEGLRGYGDLAHFFRQAGLGWPYFDYWVEYPPVFPFLSALFYRLTDGREHGYVYLLVAVFSLAQAGGLALFLRLSMKLYGPEAGLQRGWLYSILLVGLPYGWWTFDALAVFSMLVGLGWLLEGREKRAGLALGLGMLTKWFPGLVLLAAWRLGGLRRALRPASISVLLVVLVLFGLYIFAPENTLASLRSQAGKGSWETVWALLDGNLQTGNFGPQTDPLDPQTAYLTSRHPPSLSPWLTLPFFVAAGVWLSRRYTPGEERKIVAFLGLAWCLFLLWLPGYSPQWALYLLPFLLLALPERQAILVGIVLLLVDLLEWPILLSRGLFAGLWLTVPMRAVLLLLATALFWKSMQGMAQPGASTGREGGRDVWIKT